MRASGEIDHHSAEKIKQVVEKEIKRTSAVNVAFDFGCVTFMDSSGIGMLIGRYKTVTALGGTMIIFDANEQIKRLMNMSGLTRLVTVSETLQMGITQMNKIRSAQI